jgi:hypothetical protein
MTYGARSGGVLGAVVGRRGRLPLVAVLLALSLLVVPALALARADSFIGPFHTIRVVGSTVPANGDVNPYGVAVVPATVGNLVRGDVLVSNFNASSNLQGTGTTLVQVAPNGTVSQFAQIDPSTLPGSCPGGVGLTGALVVLRRGWVVVGSLPTSDGTSATAQAGCLIVLDSTGHAVETFAGPAINGPWGMTAMDAGSTAALFVSSVLNGTVAGGGKVVHRGTVLRLALAVPAQGQGLPTLTATTDIGSRFAERTDPAALVVGPQGLGLAGSTLFVADSVNNRVAAIPNALARTTSAGTGATVTTGGLVSDPLGLAIAPNGDILTTNGANGLLVETTREGDQVAAKLLDRSGTPPGAGCLFDLAIVPGGAGVYFADDCTNTLDLLD